MADGTSVKRLAIVANPEGGTGLDLIRRHRQKAGTIGAALSGD